METKELNRINWNYNDGEGWTEECIAIKGYEEYTVHTNDYVKEESYCLKTIYVPKQTLVEILSELSKEAISKLLNKGDE